MPCAPVCSKQHSCVHRCVSPVRKSRWLARWQLESQSTPVKWRLTGPRVIRWNKELIRHRCPVGDETVTQLIRTANQHSNAAFVRANELPVPNSHMADSCSKSALECSFCRRAPVSTGAVANGSTGQHRLATFVLGLGLTPGRPALLPSILWQQIHMHRSQ